MLMLSFDVTYFEATTYCVVYSYLIPFLLLWKRLCWKVRDSMEGGAADDVPREMASRIGSSFYVIIVSWVLSFFGLSFFDPADSKLIYWNIFDYLG